MLAFNSGDLVMLKSGGPVMTIDTVNTSIFDDAEITGVLCVWFVGDKLERVRFDHRAIERCEPHVLAARAPQEAAPEEVASQQVLAPQIAGEVPSGDYNAVMDSMVGAMNTPPEAQAKAKPAARRKKAPAGLAKNGPDRKADQSEKSSEAMT